MEGYCNFDDTDSTSDSMMDDSILKTVSTSEDDNMHMTLCMTKLATCWVMPDASKCRQLLKHTPNKKKAFFMYAASKTIVLIPSYG